MPSDATIVEQWREHLSDFFPPLDDHDAWDAWLNRFEQEAWATLHVEGSEPFGSMDDVDGIIRYLAPSSRSFDVGLLPREHPGHQRLRHLCHVLNDCR